MANYDLDTIRHSMAHLMAQAINRVFPNQQVQFGIGPTIDNGFYYDVKIDHKLTDEDLITIEKMMSKIIDENLPMERKIISRSEAIKIFTERNQQLKVDLINGLTDDSEISCYIQGEFIDLCRGPHLTRTGEIPKHFKLLNTAGAYWKGDAKNQMLQRVYATGFLNGKELKDHLNFLEEAKKRDHRKLGTELQLFTFDQSAPAMPFFTPKGTIIYNELIAFLRRLYRIYSYQEVITPQILESELWHTSGHYENYKENMYFTNLDNKEFAVKPMNCPTHMVLYKHFKYSYRDLPLRFADFGRIHRYEKSGTLAGLTRVRSFSQDDGHIFIPLEQIQEEILNLIDMYFTVYKHFGFTNVKVNLSTRPEKKVGSEETWDKAESALKLALDNSKHPYQINEGDGAFYGPKIDFMVADAINRYHQLGTIQLDFNLNERFDLYFTNKQGQEERPVVIHRALLGSLERFFAILLEHNAGAYPFWMAPEQIMLVPVREDHFEFTKKLSQKLSALDYRVKIDDRNESLGLKTRQAQKAKIPFMLVIGDKEMSSNELSVRAYGEQQAVTMPTEAFLDLLHKKHQERVPEKFRS